MTMALQGRYYCFTIVVRLNQIEVAPGAYLGFDESTENTCLLYTSDAADE